MKSAFLIIDVQQALCAGPYAMFDIDQVVDRINAAAVRARQAGIPLVYIQHEEADGPVAFGSEGWQLYSRLDVRPEDRIVRKTTPDSFFRTELHAWLQSQGVEHLVACGLQSDYCVDSTVRGALGHGYSVTLLSDAHSTLDNEVLTAAQISAHHNATLVNIGGYAGQVKAVKAAEWQIA
ncbi:cysteine hydrolase family protein [Chitinimonas naiadis]